MKKLLLLLLAAALAAAACACSSDGTAALAAEVAPALEEYSASPVRSGDYLLDIRLSSGYSVYSARGSFECDLSAGTASTGFTQSWIGYSSAGSNSFAGGVMTSVVDGEEESHAADQAVLFASFPYFAPDSRLTGAKDASAADNNRGRLYSFVLPGGRELCESVVGSELYALVPGIKTPRQELTEYGEVAFSCTVADGKLVSFEYEFEVKLFDTPAYVPGYSAPESEYTTLLRVSARVSVT